MIKVNMVEHYTKAIVLAREPKGELDALVTLYTQELGKVTAKVKSIRRLTSKLSAHLTPGSLTNVRIVERNGNGHQAVDALSSKTEVTVDLLRFLDFLNKVTPLNVPDLHLWQEAEETVTKGSLDAGSYHRLISIMGYDVKNASCDNCGSRLVAYFVPRDIMFLCSRCFSISGLPYNEIFPI